MVVENCGKPYPRYSRVIREVKDVITDGMQLIQKMSKFGTGGPTGLGDHPVGLIFDYEPTQLGPLSFLSTAPLLGLKVESEGRSWGVYTNVRDTTREEVLFVGVLDLLDL